MLNRRVYSSSFFVDVNQHIISLVDLESNELQFLKFYDNRYYYEINKYIIFDNIIEILVKRQNYESLSSDYPSVGRRTKERCNIYIVGTNLNYNDNNEGIDSGYIINNLSFRNYEITLK